MKSAELLRKGIEEEVYTGRRDGEVVGLSDRIVRARPGFSVEPDSRNVEHTTPPLRGYPELGRTLLAGRRRLREVLAELGGYTIVPGASLSLGDTRRFLRSEPGNAYHDFIERAYGSSVVTTSEHLNVGIEEPEALLRACRLARAEACLFLALSASSPFLDGRATGYHSTRWAVFPRTPPRVPLFASHAAYRAWIEAQLASGAMRTIRHLWASARPNGVGAPAQLERLELRVCDSCEDPALVLGLCALLEARVWQALEDEALDPLRARSGEALLELALANDTAAARTSLEAELTRWSDGRRLPASRWIAELLAEVQPVAEAHGFARYLAPLRGVLERGNTAQRWLAQHAAGRSVQEIVAGEVEAMEALEWSLAATCC